MTRECFSLLRDNTIRKRRALVNLSHHHHHLSLQGQSSHLFQSRLYSLPARSLELVSRHGCSFGFRGLDEDAFRRLPKRVVARRSIALHFQLALNRTPVHVPTDCQINFRLDMFESDFAIPLPISGGASDGPVIAVVTDAVLPISAHFLPVG